MDKKIKKYSEHKNKILLTSQDLTSVPDRNWSEISSSENQWLTNEAINPSARLQAILDCVIFNWYLNNIQDFTI